MSDDKLLTRRQILGLFGATTGAAIVGTGQADLGQNEQGNLYGGTANMAGAYQVGPGLWKGPRSVRGEVPSEDGNDFIQTDAGDDGNLYALHHYNGGWDEQGVKVTSLEADELLSVDHVDFEDAETGEPSLSLEVLQESNRNEPELRLGRDPDETAGLRLNLHNVYLGRTYEMDDGTIISDEMLKPTENGQTSLEAGGMGPLRLQSSNQPEGYFPIETGRGIVMETFDSAGDKVPRLEVYQGVDDATVQFPNTDLIKAPDGVQFTVGSDNKGRFGYDSGAGEIQLRAPQSSSDVISVSVHENKVFEFEKFDVRMGSADLDMNGKSLKNMKTQNGVTADDLKNSEIQIDASNDRICWKDDSGNAFYVGGTAL